mmetsp:Transcript_72242/g.205388  ORF Transcript_72242/g.205388 Transcript_72242/m.205388 type:complete len:267 (-) Transcript_72242:203-1003(-)
MWQPSSPSARVARPTSSKSASSCRRSTQNGSATASSSAIGRGSCSTWWSCSRRRASRPSDPTGAPWSNTYATSTPSSWPWARARAARATAPTLARTRTRSRARRRTGRASRCRAPASRSRGCGSARRASAAHSGSSSRASSTRTRTRPARSASGPRRWAPKCWSRSRPTATLTRTRSTASFSVLRPSTRLPRRTPTCGAPTSARTPSSSRGAIAASTSWRRLSLTVTRASRVLVRGRGRATSARRRAMTRWRSTQWSSCASPARAA